MPEGAPSSASEVRLGPNRSRPLRSLATAAARAWAPEARHPRAEPPPWTPMRDAPRERADRPVRKRAQPVATAGHPRKRDGDGTRQARGAPASVPIVKQEGCAGTPREIRDNDPFGNPEARSLAPSLRDTGKARGSNRPHRSWLAAPGSMTGHASRGILPAARGGRLRTPSHQARVGKGPCSPHRSPLAQGLVSAGPRNSYARTSPPSLASSNLFSIGSMGCLGPRVAVRSRRGGLRGQ